jgi:outer membrane protein assembly factor BamD (BamD/ComL family)
MRKLRKTTLLVITLIIYANIIFAFQKGTSQKYEEAKRIYDKAKKLVYKKQWEKAAESFRKIAQEFSSHDFTDDSLYWLGYSLNNLGKELDDLDQVLNVEKEALINLEVLIKNFESSQYFDDAKRLTIEIASDLVKKGFDEYKKYITKGVEEDKNIEVKIIAIDTLLNMDPQKAFPILEKIILKPNDQKLKERAIFVLAQRADPRVIPLLTKVILEDKNTRIREKAVFWLGQMGSPESLKQLVNIYPSISEYKVKKKIISSISQSGSKQAAKHLIYLYKRETNLDLKKKIIFWLGTSGTKEAQEFILNILEE